MSSRSPSWMLPHLVMVLAIGAGIVRAQTPAPKPQLFVPSQSGAHITLDVKVVRLSEDAFADFVSGAKFDRKHAAIIDCDQANELCEQLQNEEGSTIVCAPKLVTLNGQEACCRVGDEELFVTDVQCVQCNGQTAYVPHSCPVPTGCNIRVCPMLTPDQKSVMLRFQGEVAEIPMADVPLFPVTTFITPVFEGGAQGQPVPFTQFIQQPLVSSRSVTMSMGVPAGKTAVVYGGHGYRTVSDVTRVPFFADLPLIGALFEKQDETDVTDHLVYMITPRVMCGEAEQQGACQAAACAAPCCHGPLPTCAPIAVVRAANVVSLPNRPTRVQPGCCPNGPCSKVTAQASCCAEGQCPQAKPQTACGKNGSCQLQLGVDSSLVPQVKFQVRLNGKKDCAAAGCATTKAGNKCCEGSTNDECCSACPNAPPCCFNGQCVPAQQAKPCQGVVCCQPGVPAVAAAPPVAMMICNGQVCQPVAVPMPMQMTWRARVAEPIQRCSTEQSGELTLPVLMKAYREACAAGRMIEARVLAERCVAMDPLCFARGN